MWVADMDFETAPEIVEAIEKRVSHKIFGYNIVPDEYFQSIQYWWQTRHQYNMEKEWMMFCTGVVPAISSIVRKLTTVGENVLIQSPVYNIFYNSILNNGRCVLSSDLVYDGYEYNIDVYKRQALYNKNVDAILLDEAFRSLVEQEKDTFSDDTRVIYQVTKDEEAVSSKSVDVTQKPFLVFISGIDEYGRCV